MIKKKKKTQQSLLNDLDAHVYLLHFLLTKIDYSILGGRLVKQKLNDRHCSLIAVGTKNLIVAIISECVINHLVLICFESRCSAQRLKEPLCYLAAPSNQREDVNKTQHCISNLWGQESLLWCTSIHRSREQQ